MIAGATTLSGLRDVDDVLGSFLVDDGGLRARDLPPVFRDELFDDAGPRLMRLRDTLAQGEPTLVSFVLRFSEHRLYVRSAGDALLCVLTGVRVNVPALRMATNLVVKRVEADAAAGRTGQAVPVPPVRESITPPPPSVSSHRREVLYRGRRPG